MIKVLGGFGAASALALAMPATPAGAAEAQARPASAQSVQADDVTAPPMALLFGIGAVGLIWGRCLAASARKARERAEGSD